MRNPLDWNGKKGDVNAEKIKAYSGADLYLLTTGGDHLCVLLESQYSSTPDIDPPSADLGKFSVPL